MVFATRIGGVKEGIGRGFAGLDIFSHCGIITTYRKCIKGTHPPKAYQNACRKARWVGRILVVFFAYPRVVQEITLNFACYNFPIR